MALLDEATVAALSGELQPMTTGIIYCNQITTCEQMADYKRSGDWTDAARRWCERQAIAGFPGMCRVHRAEVIRRRGAWQEARNGYAELRGFIAGYAAEALYQIGEIRLYRGDLVEARDAFRQAHELGREPNPGLALLRLAEGETEAAQTAVKRGLAAERRPLARARHRVGRGRSRNRIGRSRRARIDRLDLWDRGAQGTGAVSAIRRQARRGRFGECRARFL